MEKEINDSQKALPEITLKGMVLAVILTIILCASNAYLGLKVGSTISASIPAAIIAMAVLRFFKKSNILENNIVQTTASVGEALVAGIAYVTPALLVISYWDHFHFWSIVGISLLGGLLGMLFSIPVRRIMLNNPALRFPEGTAIGAVLKGTSGENSAEIKPLLLGGCVSALIGLFQTGFGIVSDNFNYWVYRGSSLFGFGVGFSPALLAAGYIVGANVAISMFSGLVLGWLIGMPILSHVYGLSDPTDMASAAMDLWSAHIRFIGVGAMLVGGVWTILTLLKPISQGIYASFISIKEVKLERAKNADYKVPRTERDIPIHWVGLFLVMASGFLFFLLYELVPAVDLGLSEWSHIGLILFTVFFTLTFGFLFASISSYFAGLIGSTNNPGSGITISCLLLFSLCLIALFRLWNHIDHAKAVTFSAFVIIEASVIATIVTISNDTMQDLKAGQIVGATPWKQQAVLVVGVVVASFIIAPILKLLFHAYGIAGVFPRPGMPVSAMLAAPQATLMASVVQGVFGHNLPWAMIFIGAIIAVFAILIDEIAKTRGQRFPVLAVGLGVYLPIGTSTPMIIGGFLAYLVNVKLHKKHLLRGGENVDSDVTHHQHRGILLACGLVAGASIMGVLLAIPFAIAQTANALRIVSSGFLPIANLLGFVSLFFICYWIYRTVLRTVSN